MLIRNKNDLPEHFELDKYKVFESLDDREFFNQLLARHYMVADYEQWIDENDIKAIMSNPVTDRKYSEDAFSGLEYVMTNEQADDNNCAARLSSSILVEPLQRHDIFKITQSKKVIEQYEDTDTIGLLESVNLIDDFGRDFFVKLDLHYPDEFLIDDLSSLLSSWRKSLNIPDPNNDLSINSWEVARAKILRYGIFPYADLYAWQKITGNKIKSSVLAGAIFPDLTIGEKQLCETIKPFFEKILSNFSMEKFEREVRERLTEQKNRRRK